MFSIRVVDVIRELVVAHAGGGDTYGVEFLFFSFLVAVFVVTASAYFNVTQRRHKEVLNFVLAYTSMVSRPGQFPS